MGFSDSICSRCVMDSTIPEIRFDASGECQYCAIHDTLEQDYPLGVAGQERLDLLVQQIKAAGKNKEFDCVVGTSGGRDSTWTMYTAVQLGLRPLAVHFDNGWNSEIAVTNIHNSTSKLGVELETVVADWEEFKDLQIAFLKASVPDVEVPTDLAIHSVLHYVAAKEGIKYILNGHSFRTEGVAPIGWTYFDGRYIEAVQRRFGSRRLKDFKNFGVRELVYYTFFKGIKVSPILNYSPYDQAAVTKLLEDELGWTYYGGHHHESYYTKFIQSYLLPKKFNIDKRKTEFSALVRSGQMSREAALREISENPYEYDDELLDYALSKLSLSHEQWDEIFNNPPKSFLDYPNYYKLMLKMRRPIKWAVQMDLLPKLLYLKYLS